MFTSIPSLDSVVQCLLPAFTQPSFQTQIEVLLGWVMCLGKRTEYGVFQATQAETPVSRKERHPFDRFYNFFSRSAWTVHDLAYQVAVAVVVALNPSGALYLIVDDNTLFGMAVKPLPQGESRPRVVPAMLELVQMLAVHELLKAKSLLERYAASGLTDATTLRQAVEEAAGQLQVTGRAKGVVHQAAVRNGFATAYVIAEQSDLSAYLLQPTELEKVQAAYRDVMHRQARDLMARSAWADALLLWQHLHQRRLVSQQLYLDAARCFQRLGQAPDAARVLSEAIETFAKSGTAEFFEQAGDMALEIQTEPAETLAERAYQRAIDTLRDTVSGPGTSAGNDLANKTP